MKKLLLGLATTAAIVAPITSVVACSVSVSVDLGDNTKVTTKDGALSEIKITAAKESDTAEIIATTFIPGANSDLTYFGVNLIRGMDADKIKGYITIVGITSIIDDEGKLIIAKAIEANLHPAPVTPVETDLDSSKSEADLKAVLPTAVTSIDTANTELGITLPTLVGSDFKSITWDNSTLMLTLVTTVTATQTDTTMIYKVMPAVIHNLDGNTKVFMNNDTINKIEITASAADSAEAIAAKYIKFSNSDENEWTNVLKRMNAIALAKLLDITGPTTPISDDGKLTIANSLIALVTTIEDGSYDLNATTKVTILNHVFNDIHITVATTVSDTIAQNYLPGAHVDTKIAPLLKYLTVTEISKVITCTFTGYEGNGLIGNKENIASAILASVNPITK